jgi:uncharacterized protein YodC (DUF2158 family)
MTQFKIGDIVRLKSGGPAMTINRVHPNSVTCIYYNEQTNVFEFLLDVMPECLEISTGNKW